MSIAQTPPIDADPPLPLRMRRDLVVAKLQFGRRSYWNIKDPVTLRYFQLREEEYFILRALDGQATASEIRRRFEHAFSPLRLAPQQFRSYLSSLHSQGLIVSDAAGQGDSLLRRRAAYRRARWLAAVSNMLAIRWRGIDPQRFLQWLYPKCRWLFSRWVLAATLLLVVSALALIVVQHPAVLARLSGFDSFFRPGNLIWIAAAIGSAKVLHELGHALTCTHFGGRCHEMGVMLLVFTPCLYCNVSDAWLMHSKWQRVAISAAGIYVEIILASLAAWLWWYSEPGLLNTICLNMMLVCSVNTLLFNGNPLLRYDGYYVLADLVEVPNLRERASQLLSATLSAWCLGTGRPADRVLPDRGRGLLLAYGVTSAIYRIVVIAGILWFLHVVLRPLGLVVFAQVVTVLFCGTMVLMWLRRLGTFLRRAVRDKQASRFRACVCAASAAAVLAVICLVPLPYRVAAPVVIEPRDAEAVFVSLRGRIPRAGNSEKRFGAGDHLRQGDVLVTLENPSLDKEIIQLEGQIEILRSRIGALAAMRVRDEQAADQLPSAEEAIRNLEKQLEQRVSRKRLLTLTAPLDGVVLPDEQRAAARLPGDLGSWQGTPLDAVNAGCTLESGTTFCLIGDPARLSATLVVDQSDVELVRAGQQVRIWLRQLPGETLTGTIGEVSDSQLETAPRGLVAAGALPVVYDESGTARPASASFLARVPIDARGSAVPLRSTGRAKIKVRPQSLARRIYRYLAGTFRFA